MILGHHITGVGNGWDLPASFVVVRSAPVPCTDVSIGLERSHGEHLTGTLPRIQRAQELPGADASHRYFLGADPGAGNYARGIAHHGSQAERLPDLRGRSGTADRLLRQ